MPALMRSVDVIALPSYYREGVPKSLIEAAACGLAVVTTNLPGCREVVSEHGVDGLHVEPRVRASLAERLAQLDDDRVLVRRLGDRSAPQGDGTLRRADGDPPHDRGVRRTAGASRRMPSRRGGLTRCGFLREIARRADVSACVDAGGARAGAALVFAVLKWKRVAFALAIVAIGWSAFWSLPRNAEWLRESLEGRYAVESPNVLPNADAIVVLGGGGYTWISRPGVTLDDLKYSRLAQGARLYIAGRAPRVILSGGGDRRSHRSTQHGARHAQVRRARERVAAGRTQHRHDARMRAIRRRSRARTACARSCWSPRRSTCRARACCSAGRGCR